MRTRVTLECTECKQRNYNMTKDKKTHPERMKIQENTANYLRTTRYTKKQNNYGGDG